MKGLNLGLTSSEISTLTHKDTAIFFICFEFLLSLFSHQKRDISVAQGALKGQMEMKELLTCRSLAETTLIS